MTTKRYLMIKSSGDGRPLLQANHLGIDANVTADQVAGDVTVRDSTTGRLKERGSNLRISWLSAFDVAWTNMPAALTIFMSDTGTGMSRELDLRGFTQFRIHVGVGLSTTGVAAAKIGAQYSINGTDYFGLDNGTATTISTVVVTDLSAAVRLVSTWGTLNTAARIAGIYVQVYGVDGDGAGDARFNNVEIEFR